MLLLDVLLTVMLFCFIFVRYAVTAGGLYWLCWKVMREKWDHRRLTPDLPDPEVLRREIRWSLVTSAIMAVGGTLTYRLWAAGHTRIYLEPDRFGWAWLPVSLFLLMFLHDTYFYWTHRLLHWRPLYVRYHRVHHESRNPSPWAAFSFHPVEAVIQALIFPALVLIVPVHLSVFGTFLLVMTVTGSLNHLGFELYPSVVVKNRPWRYFISATHHTHHHRRVNVNYGLYFTFWDLALRTEAECPDVVRNRPEVRQRGQAPVGTRVSVPSVEL